MGSSASKTARKLPTTTRSPAWAGARTPHSDQIIPPGMQVPPGYEPGIKGKGKDVDRSMNTGGLDTMSRRTTPSFTGDKDDGMSFPWSFGVLAMRFASVSGILEGR